MFIPLATVFCYTKLMSKNKIIFIVGLLTIIIQFLGFPSSWNDVFYLILGLILVVVAVISHNIRRKAVLQEHKEVVTEVYVQSSGNQQM